MGIPLAVELDGLGVTCVGAGSVAAAKLRPFPGEGAVVTVVAPDAVESIRAAARAGSLTWHPRRYRTDDVEGAVLVLAATGDGELNGRVAADARAAGTLCIRVDQSAEGSDGGTAALLAGVRRGPLLLAVSTGGAAPALAARLRAELERRYGPEYGELARLLGELRRDPAVRARLAGLDGGERRARWRAILDTDILDLLRTGRSRSAREVASACLSSSSD